MRRPARSCFAALVFIVLLTACVGQAPDDRGPSPGAPTPGADPQEGDWSEPGLVDRGGNPVEVLPPAPARGRSLDARDFGASPAADGRDDAPAIRDAIAAAEEDDEVVLPAGTYELRSADPEDESANVVLRSGVDLRGAGAGQTILVTSFDGEDDSSVIRGVGVSDVIVADLTITSRHDGPLGEDPDDGKAGGGPMYGIRLGARDGRVSERMLISGVSIEKFQRHGISAKSTREVILSGNQLADATAVGPGGQGYGIAVEGMADKRDPDSATDSRHNVVVRNAFDGEHLRHAILLQFPTHNNLVADNIIIGSILDAIDLHGEGEYLNEIRGNTISGGNKAGIALGNSGGSTNKHDASGEGNWVHHNTLRRNHIGILVILGTPGTLIEHNGITAREGSVAGIEVRNGPRTTIRDNTIRDGGGEFWAIRLREDTGADGRGAGVPTAVTIANNRILRAANGILVDEGEGIEIADNTLEQIVGTRLRIADGALR